MVEMYLMFNEFYLPKKMKGTIDFSGQEYSISKLADYCKCSRQQIYKIINGECIPNVIISIKMAEYYSQCLGYEVTVENLFSIYYKYVKEK